MKGKLRSKKWNNESVVRQVAEKFVLANCYDPKIAMQFFYSECQEKKQGEKPVLHP